MSAAPIINGRRKLLNPARIGTADEEDHRRAVHREELVVRLRLDDVRVGLRQLGADDQRENASREEEREARCDVQDPDLLVVGRGSSRMTRPSYHGTG